MRARRVGEDRADLLDEAHARRPVGAIARRAGRRAPRSRSGSGTVRRCRAATGAAPARRDWARARSALRRRAGATPRAPGPRLTREARGEIASRPAARPARVAAPARRRATARRYGRRSRHARAIRPPRERGRSATAESSMVCPRAIRAAAHDNAAKRARKERPPALDRTPALVLSYNPTGLGDETIDGPHGPPRPQTRRGGGSPC